MDGKFLLPSGTNSGLTQLYVDTRAATDEADGSAMHPFRSIDLAIKVCPIDIMITPAGLAEVRMVQAAGVYSDVIVDRSCALRGPAVISGITFSAGFNYSLDLTLKDVILAGTLITLTNVDISGSLAISTPDVFINNAYVGPDTLILDPEVTGNLYLRNSVVATTFIVPASWTVAAENSYLADASGAGTIELYNSTNGA